MKTLVKNFLLSFSYPEVPQLNETECLIAEIEEARNKIQYAWNRFDYAAPEYVELAVLELHLAEAQYCLLNKRYRLNIQNSMRLSQPPQYDIHDSQMINFI